MRDPLARLGLGTVTIAAMLFVSVWAYEAAILGSSTSAGRPGALWETVALFVVLGAVLGTGLAVLGYLLRRGDARRRESLLLLAATIGISLAGYLLVPMRDLAAGFPGGLIVLAAVAAFLVAQTLQGARRPATQPAAQEAAPSPTS